MFRRLLVQPTLQVTRQCLINQNLNNFNQCINQKRYLITKIVKNGNKKTLKFFLFSFASGLAVLTYYDYYQRREAVSHIKTIAKEWDPIQRKVGENNLIVDSLIGNYLDASVLDKLTIHKKVDGKTKLPGKRFILLQYTNCPFCSKVRTFLNYYGIPFEIVEVHPVTRDHIKFSKYRKVPILLIEDDKLRKDKNQIIQLNDSSSIISVLGTYLFCNPKKELEFDAIINQYENLQYIDSSSDKQVKQISNKYFLLYGDTLSDKQFKDVEKNLLNERKFRKWTDDSFVHVLSPNIYRTTTEAFEAFNHFSKVSDWEKHFSTFGRLSAIYFGSFGMYLISKRLKKKYRLKDDVRQPLYDDCNYFLKSKGSQNEFMGGALPNLSDLSVYGVLSSIEGCEAFRDLIANTKLSTWYYKMKQLVEEQKGADLLKI